METWFVDAKHYKRGVPPEALQGLLTWAEAEQPSTSLIIASGFLSNPAKDWLAAYERNRRPPFRIRHWEKPTLDRMLVKHPDLMAKHGVIGEEMRTLAEIVAAEQEYFDKVWYVRKLILEEKINVVNMHRYHRRLRNKRTRRCAQSSNVTVQKTSARGTTGTGVT